MGLHHSGDEYWGRPILDAVVAGNDVYVVPVVVRPEGDDAYLAAARLRPLGGGDFDVVQLFADHQGLSGNTQNPNLTGLREIERDAAGNLYVLNVHGENNSSLLWRFGPDGAILKQRRLNTPIDPNRIPHPSRICYTRNRVYVASGANDPSGPNRVKLYVLDATDLSGVGFVTIDNMFHITSLAAVPDGFLSVVGYTILTDGHDTGTRRQSIPAARIATFHMDETMVEADALPEDQGLAVPMSIISPGY